MLRTPCRRQTPGTNASSRRETAPERDARGCHRQARCAWHTVPQPDPPEAVVNERLYVRLCQRRCRGWSRAVASLSIGDRLQNWDNRSPITQLRRVKNLFYSCPRLFNASTSGCTACAPACRNSAATSVIVHPVSTVSSSNRQAAYGLLCKST